jgi:hypothetical protein
MLKMLKIACFLGFRRKMKESGIKAVHCRMFVVGCSGEEIKSLD